MRTSKISRVRSRLSKNWHYHQLYFDMSLALPRVVRLGPLVGHLRDRRVIRSADKKCLRPRHVVSSLYRPWVLWKRCHDPVPHGRAIGAVYVPAVKSKFACLKDPDRPPWEQGKSADDFAAGFRGFVCPPDHRESPSGIDLRF